MLQQIMHMSNHASDNVQEKIMMNHNHRKRKNKREKSIICMYVCTINVRMYICTYAHMYVNKRVHDIWTPAVRKNKGPNIAREGEKHTYTYTYIYIGLRSFFLNAAHTIAQQKSKKAKARTYTYIFRRIHTIQCIYPEILWQVYMHTTNNTCPSSGTPLAARRGPIPGT